MWIRQDSPGFLRILGIPRDSKGILEDSPSLKVYEVSEVSDPSIISKNCAHGEDTMSGSPD